MIVTKAETYIKIVADEGKYIVDKATGTKRMRFTIISLKSGLTEEDYYEIWDEEHQAEIDAEEVKKLEEQHAKLKEYKNIALQTNRRDMKERFENFTFTFEYDGVEEEYDMSTTYLNLFLSKLLTLYQYMIVNGISFGELDYIPLEFYWPQIGKEAKRMTGEKINKFLVSLQESIDKVTKFYSERECEIINATSKEELAKKGYIKLPEETTTTETENNL